MSSERTEDACRECGAPLSFEDCLSHFHALLALEHGFPDAPSSILHFYAVAAYNLQRPDGAEYTLAALQSLRQNLADALDDKASVTELRRGARLATDGKRAALSSGPASAAHVTELPHPRCLNKLSHTVVANSPFGAECYPSAEVAAPGLAVFASCAIVFARRYIVRVSGAAGAAIVAPAAREALIRVGAPPVERTVRRTRLRVGCW